ncbi:MAG TPA: DEAD/DEAH box helicase [Candidatus Saccharimonadales bacterium]
MTHDLEILPPALEDARMHTAADWIRGHCQPAAQAILRDLPPGVQPPENPFEIREYQVASWSSIWYAREQGAHSALVALATGLGKTSVAAFDYLKYREERAAAGKQMPNGLFISHQVDISEQAARRFREYIPGLAVNHFNPRSANGKRLRPGFTYATVQGVAANLDEIDPYFFDYMVYDEAHHMMADTWEPVVEYLRPLFRLALSATPNRLDRRDVRKHFGTEVYARGLAEAIAEGDLVDVDYHIVVDDAIKEMLEQGGETVTLKMLNELVDVQLRSPAVADTILKERERLNRPKTLVFCNSIAHADEMAALLGGSAYHSGISKSECQKIFKRFRSGEEQILCAVDGFNEGLDVPDIGLVAFLRSTLSPTIFEQQIGRGMRRAPGKDMLTVLDFVANAQRVIALQKLAEDIERAAARWHQRQQARGGQSAQTAAPDFTHRSDAGGMRVHGPHANFIFSKVAVDLAEVFRRLEANAANAPGIYSLYTASMHLQVGQPTLKAKIDELGWKLPMHRFGPKTAEAVTDAQIDELRTRFPETFAPKAEKGWRSKAAAADELGVADSTLDKAIQSLGVEPPIRRFRNGMAVPGISPILFDRLDKRLSQMLPPEGVVSLYGIALETHSSLSSVRNVVRDLKIPTDKYRFYATRGDGVEEMYKQVILDEINRRRGQ